MRHLLTSRAIVVVVVAAAAAAVYALAMWTERALARAGVLRQNFRGDCIVTAYGAFIVLFAAPILAAAAALTTGADRRAIGGMLLAVGGFGALGFLDDVFGDRKQTGLRGHLRALLKERRLTTGLLKAAGGLAIGFVASRFVLARPWADAALDALVIALGANAMNLLDLRPGRMTAAFLALAAPIACALGLTGAFGALGALAVVMVPAVVAHYRDARAQVMQGDTGSNALGAALGVAYAIAAPSFAARSVAVALLVALHVAAERWSLTALIDGSPLLRRIDALTGVRTPDRPAPRARSAGAGSRRQRRRRTARR